MPLLFSIVNGHLFGMKAAEMIVPSFSDDLTVLDQHATDQWVWADLSSATFGNQQRPFHERNIVLGPCVVHITPRRVEFKTSCMGDSCGAAEKPAEYAE